MLPSERTGVKYLGLHVLVESRRAAGDLIDCSLQFSTDRMPGHLCTIWKQPEAGKTHRHPPLVLAARKLRASG